MNTSLTIITLSDMAFYAYHGCYAEEQAIGNHFLVQLQLAYDASAAASSDQLDQALNYAEAYRLTAEEMQQASRLLEHVAARILQRLMAAFPQLVRAEVTVSKLNPPMQGQMRQVSVTMQQQRPA